MMIGLTVEVPVPVVVGVYCSVLNQWSNIGMCKLNLTLFRRNFVFAVGTKIFV